MRRFTLSFTRRAWLLMALCATFAMGCSDDDGPETKGTPWTIRMTAKIEQARTIEFILDKENPVTIDWGDGSEVNALNWHHDYQPGTYDITLSGQGAIGLTCFQCDLTSLDVSQCPVLTDLNCGYNSLTSLDVSACPELTSLACHVNEIAQLDLENCPLIDTLIVGVNKLTRLDITHNTKLIALDCGSNQLSALDISYCFGIATLFIDNNKFTTEALQSIVDALPDRSRLGSGLLFWDENEADVSCIDAKNWKVTAK